MVKCGYVKWADDRRCQGCNAEISFTPRNKPILVEIKSESQERTKQESESWLSNVQTE